MLKQKSKIFQNLSVSLHYHEAGNSSSSLINRKLQKISVLTGGKELSKPQTCTESPLSPLARKNAPLPAVLVRAFPEWPNSKHSNWNEHQHSPRKISLAFGMSPLQWLKTAFACLTIHHHTLQNSFQKHTHRELQISSSVANTQSLRSPRSCCPHPTRETRLDSTFQ